MASAFVVETDRWDGAQKLFEPLQNNSGLSSLAGKPGPYQSGAKHSGAENFHAGSGGGEKGSSDAQKSIDELQALIKPSHELFGEILLRAKRQKEAAEQFATSLGRNKDRARSLLGVARAAARRDTVP